MADPKVMHRPAGPLEDLLIVAVSARALSQSARAAHPHARITVLDWFADQDTRAAADEARRVPTDRHGGFRGRDLLALARALAPSAALLVGSGFERRPHLLARLADGRRLLGTPPSTLVRLKDPRQFFGQLDRLGIAHPAVAQMLAEAGPGWLVKRIGGAGGSHVRPARREGPAKAGTYFQRAVSGHPVSVAFLADLQGGFRIVGLTEQWVNPTPRMPYRYGGAALPAAVPVATQDAMVGALARLVPGSGLLGLCSADFLVGPEGPHLLEINPRPGATLDILDRALATPLIAQHCALTLGRPIELTALPRLAANASGLAAAIVYAPGRLIIPPNWRWPAWTADRPDTGFAIARGEPVCTVYGEGVDARAARAQAGRRAERILSGIGADQKILEGQT